MTRINKKGTIHFSVGALFFLLLLVVTYILISITNPQLADTIRENMHGLATAVKP